MTFPIYLPDGTIIDADNPTDQQEIYNKMMDKATQEFNPWRQCPSCESRKDIISEGERNERTN